MFCIQQTQSMNLAIPSNNDGYEIETKNLKDRPTIPLSKKYNSFSEQLYSDNITECEIRQLVKHGAELNYIKTACDTPLVLFFACNGTKQGVKNMKTIIDLGVAIHNLDNQEHTPLRIAVQENLTDMIQLLMPYEKSTVTIYEGSRNLGTRSLDEEKRTREYIINLSFSKQNVASIKSLLDLKLMTANRGLKEFAHHMKPNPEILNLLGQYGANNGGDVLPKIMKEAFPWDQYSQFLKQICTSNVCNEEVLARMKTIKKNVDEIVLLLEFQ